MPRGKNYVNNNRGVTLQSRNSRSMQLCEYGAGCTRANCIYRHPDEGDKNSEVTAVCLPFLAGTCTFTKGCRKRHPGKEECERLIAKYKRTRCRFGNSCRTEGCLYLHPGCVVVPENHNSNNQYNNNNNNNNDNSMNDRNPYSNNYYYKPGLNNKNTMMQQSQQQQQMMHFPPLNSAWKPTTAPHGDSGPLGHQQQQVQVQRQMQMRMPMPMPMPMPMQMPMQMQQRQMNQQQYHHNETRYPPLRKESLMNHDNNDNNNGTLVNGTTSFNANAKEFVPGNFTVA